MKLVLSAAAVGDRSDEQKDPEATSGRHLESPADEEEELMFGASTRDHLTSLRPHYCGYGRWFLGKLIRTSHARNLTGRLCSCAPLVCTFPSLVQCILITNSGHTVHHERFIRQREKEIEREIERRAVAER